MKKGEVIRILKSHRKELEEHFFVSSLSLFGSVARDEASADSDVDLLVEFSKPVGCSSSLNSSKDWKNCWIAKLTWEHPGH
jgi:predicted nucleotidyltransferase